MGLLVHGAKPLFTDVGVDLGRLQAGVAEQFLDDTQVGPPIEQVGGEAVAKGVRMGWRR